MAEEGINKVINKILYTEENIEIADKNDLNAEVQISSNKLDKQLEGSQEKQNINIQKDETVKFKDHNLWYEMNGGINGSGKGITYEEILTIKKLELGSNKKSYEGLEYAANLEELAISHYDENIVLDLKTIGKLKNLKKLKIYIGSFAVDISDLKDLTNLEEVTLPLLTTESVVTINNWKKLKILNLRDNQLTNIDFLSGLDEIEKLNLNNNQIRNINPLKNARNLRSLFMNNNQLKI